MMWKDRKWSDVDGRIGIPRSGRYKRRNTHINTPRPSPSFTAGSPHFISASLVILGSLSSYREWEDPNDQVRSRSQWKGVWI